MVKPAPGLCRSPQARGYPAQSAAHRQGADQRATVAKSLQSLVDAASRSIQEALALVADTPSLRDDTDGPALEAINAAAVALSRFDDSYALSIRMAERRRSIESERDRDL